MGRGYASQDGRSSRRQVLGAAVSVGVFLSGCQGIDAITGAETAGLSESKRETIVERYADGRAARRTASEQWADGRDAWELHYFGTATTAWREAERQFGDAATAFTAAREHCKAAGATAGEDLCADSKAYCEKMAVAAGSHADAAKAYRTGAFETGDGYLEEGWNHYQSAIDHEVRRQDQLEDALDEDGS